MKKLIILGLICSTLLIGCQNNEVQDNHNYDNRATYVEEDWDAVKKAQEIRVIKASDVVQIIQDEIEIESFINKLDIEHWTIDTISNNANIEGKFIFYQSPTQKFGETEPDKTLYKILELIVYQDTPYISLAFGEEVIDLTLTFRLPEESYAMLQDYLK